MCYLRARVPSQDHPGCTEAPIGRDVWMRSTSARFMNCSSASTRAVCGFFANGNGARKKRKDKNAKNCQQPARSRGQRARTYAQKTVEIDAARVERAMEMINRVLDRVIFGYQVDESVGGGYVLRS